MSETLNEAALRIWDEMRVKYRPDTSLLDDFAYKDPATARDIRLEFARRLRAEWEKEGQEPLRVALEAEKACEEAFAIRVMGQEAYDNSPCQAHPLELVERWLAEQEPCGYFQMHNGSYEQVGLSYKKDPDVFPLYRRPAPKEVEPTTATDMAMKLGPTRLDVMVERFRQWSNKLMPDAQAREMFEYVMGVPKEVEPEYHVASPELTAQVDAAAKAGRFVFEPGWNEPPATDPQEEPFKGAIVAVHRDPDTGELLGDDYTRPQEEPVAWLVIHSSGHGKAITFTTIHKDDAKEYLERPEVYSVTPLYTRPQHDRVKELEAQRDVYRESAENWKANCEHWEKEAAILETAYNVRDMEVTGLQAKITEQAAELQECKRLDTLRVAKIKTLETENECLSASCTGAAARIDAQLREIDALTGENEVQAGRIADQDALLRLNGDAKLRIVIEQQATKLAELKGILVDILAADESENDYDYYDALEDARIALGVKT